LRYFRHGEGLEFERLAFFTDAVFAIAMTLLIVAVSAPVLRDHDSSRELLEQLGEQGSEFAAFFIGFVVLGGYWAANHRFFSRLQAISGGYLALALLYLAFVAWLPFPTALLGELAGNPVAVGGFAVSAGIVSGCEALLLWCANRQGLFRQPLPDPVFRHAMRTSLLPEVFFAASLPIAFWSPLLAIAVWFLSAPAQVALDRLKPEGFADYFR
jgi:uncharacterized membrane protein